MYSEAAHTTFIKAHPQKSPKGNMLRTRFAIPIHQYFFMTKYKHVLAEPKGWGRRGNRRFPY